MPVSSAKQKAEDPGDIQPSPPLNGSRLRERVEQYRHHHTICKERRANGVSYEIRVEAMHTEALQRKYFDNLRQQQAISGRLEGPGGGGAGSVGTSRGGHHSLGSGEGGGGENGSMVSPESARETRRVRASRRLKGSLAASCMLQGCSTTRLAIAPVYTHNGALPSN